MESTEQGKAALILGIEADARSEEERLVKEAETQAAEKIKYARKKADSLLDEARDKATAQGERIKQKAISEAEREIKRRALRMRDTLMQDVVARTREKLNAMIGDPDYRTILANWITEAAIGLGADAARISASARELPLIDESLLADVRQRVSDRTGKPTFLTVSDAGPLESQGIVLTTMDGRMAFNNQVTTRISRKQREIQMLIYDAVFTGSQEE
jgi:vacuolar-type H+-ATPase subunit E/Vma4